MAKVTTPNNDFIVVPTKKKTVTLINSRFGYYVRKWFIPSIIDSDFQLVLEKVTQISQYLWDQKTEQEKETYNQIAETYDREGNELFNSENKSACFQKEYNANVFDRLRFW